MPDERASTISHEEAVSRALLIAAAPDLLAALEGLIKVVGPQWASFLVAPYAAIDKARGAGNV